MAQEQEPPLGKAEFWMPAATLSFGLWSLMIPIGIYMMRDAFKDASVASQEVAKKLGEHNARFESYVLTMERRVTLLEERQAGVMRTLDEIDRHYRDVLESRSGKVRP